MLHRDEHTAKLKKLISTDSYHSSEVLVLVRLGADPNITDDQRRPLLHRLVERMEWSETVYSALQELVNEWGADIHIKDASGRTPLQFLMRNPFLLNDAMLLLYLKADPNVKDSEGYTLLHRAVRDMHGSLPKSKAIKELVNVYQVDINSRDGDGFTPLQWLMDENIFYADDALYLIRLGADVRVKNMLGESLLDLFKKSKASSALMEELTLWLSIAKPETPEIKEEKGPQVVYKKIISEKYSDRKLMQLGKQSNMKETLLQHLDTLDLEQKTVTLKSIFLDATECKCDAKKATLPLTKVLLAPGKETITLSSPLFKTLASRIEKCDTLQRQKKAEEQRRKETLHGQKVLTATYSFWNKDSQVENSLTARSLTYRMRTLSEEGL